MLLFKTNVLSGFRRRRIMLEGMQPKHLDLPDSFAKIVERSRKAKAISRASLATRAGLHQTYIGLMERGKRTPNLETAQSIAEALGLPLSELIAKAEALGNRKRPPQR